MSVEVWHSIKEESMIILELFCLKMYLESRIEKTARTNLNYVCPKCLLIKYWLLNGLFQRIGSELEFKIKEFSITKITALFY